MCWSALRRSERLGGGSTLTPSQPTNTFHVGFWFNQPEDATNCGFTGFTPFNGEHQAGPLAMISLPEVATDLGPLCFNPDFSSDPVRCNP